MAEAKSARHQRSHFPHNPFCNVCVQAHLRQQTFKKSGEKGDDGLPAVKEKNQVLSADWFIAQRSASGVSKRGKEAIEEYASFGVRDAYSGVGICQPKTQRTKDKCYGDLKGFTGPSIQKRSPHVVVKSDAAPEIMSAVYDLGWHSEPSLPGKWPRNTEHERWGQSVKSVCRANMLQSGLPTKVVPWCMMYSAIALAADQPCPIHAHERDAAGNALPEYA